MAFVDEVTQVGLEQVLDGDQTDDPDGSLRSRTTAVVRCSLAKRRASSRSVSSG